MSTAAALTSPAADLSCILIPTAGLQVLLPNVCVAEIVPMRRMKSLQQGPKWCSGYVLWRGSAVPVVNYAGFDPDYATPPDDARCLVIMNRTNAESPHEFYAMQAQGLPRMLQLGDGDIGELNEPLGPADQAHVALGTIGAIIPNLDYVEAQIASLPKI